MKNYILIISMCSFSSGLVLSQSTGTPGYENDPHWYLDGISSDEFNGTTIDNTKWHVMDNFDHYGHTWVARSSNSYIDNGVAILEFKEENPSYGCPASALNLWGCAEQDNTGNPYDFSTGYLRSKFVIKPGSYLETRIKLPKFYNMNAAFWLINTAQQPPGNGIYNEIDMLEAIWNGGLSPYNVSQSSNIHFDVASSPTGTYEAFFVMGTDDQDWHTYGLEYTTEKLIWYIDNVKVREEENPSFPGIFDVIISNGGDNITSLDPTAETRMQIDYVRHYRLKEDCENINVATYNFALHDNEVKNQIIIGNSSSTNSISSSSIVSLRAKTGIQITGNFTVPLGSEFTMYPNDCNVVYP